MTQSVDRIEVGLESHPNRAKMAGGRKPMDKLNEIARALAAGALIYVVMVACGNRTRRIRAGAGVSNGSAAVYCGGNYDSVTFILPN